MAMETSTELWLTSKRTGLAVSEMCVMAECGPTEFREELERVLSSRALGYSDAIRRLLAYLGERALTTGNAGIKEYTIGIEVFQKPADYNPQEDPAVRVLASKLRSKLDEYYRTEGAENPVRIELPRGRYHLKFQAWPPLVNGIPGTVASVEPRKWRWVSGFLALALAVTVLLAAHWRISLSHRDAAAAAALQTWNPELELIWQPYLESNRRILIAFGTPLFTKFSGGFFRDPKLNQWEEAESSDRLRGVQKALESSYAHPSFNFTGVGEASGIFLLCKLLLARKPDLRLESSKAVSWTDIGSHNVIFLGSPKFIVQLQDLPFEQDFVIEGGSVRNLRPRPGEPEKFREVRTSSHSAILEDYALLTALPGLHGRGRITILASSSTEGTWAASEYVTEAHHARDLVARLRLPSGRLPEAYQVLIRAKFKEQVPIEMSYVTHRVLKAAAAHSASR